MPKTLTKPRLNSNSSITLKQNSKSQVENFISRLLQSLQTFKQKNILWKWLNGLLMYKQFSYLMNEP